jgi:hypothetical protein
MSIPMVARERLGKSPLIAAKQRLGKNIPTSKNTNSAIEVLLEPSFPLRSVLYQGKQDLLLIITFLYKKPIICSTYIRRTSGHCLGTFKIGDIVS